MIDGWVVSCEITLRWMSQGRTDDKSTLVQVMATSHYLSQCWPRSMSPYGVTRPQWVNRKSVMLLILMTKTYFENTITFPRGQLSVKSAGPHLLSVSNQCRRSKVKKNKKHQKTFLAIPHIKRQVSSINVVTTGSRHQILWKVTGVMDACWTYVTLHSYVVMRHSAEIKTGFVLKVTKF